MVLQENLWLKTTEQSSVMPFTSVETTNSRSERCMKTKDKVLNYTFAKFEHGKHTKKSLEQLQACDIEQWRPEEIQDGTELGEVEK